MVQHGTKPIIPRYQSWLCGGLLALITIALYWPTRHFDFVELDDPGYVFENQSVRGGLSFAGVVWSFIDVHQANWHPLTWVSHMVDCQLFGLHPGAHHLVNATIHAVNACLLFGLLLRLSGAFWRSALVAALFAWHPLRIESVAWISERKDVLSGLFFMLPLWAYTRYAHQRRANAPGADGAVGSPRSTAASRYYALSLLFFALGLLSKPILVTLPLVLLLLDFWPLNRFAEPNLTGSFSRQLVIEKVPFFALSGISGVITFLAQRADGAVASLSSVTLTERLSRVLLGFSGYVQNFFWPQNLSVLSLPGHAVRPASLAIAGLVLAGATTVAIVARRQRPWLTVGWFWFVGMLLPVSGLVQAGPQLLADRYTYLSGIGLLVMLIWETGEVVERLQNGRLRSILTAGAAVPVVAACLCLSRHQLNYWRNTEALMSHALEVNPDNYIAHNLLGAYFARQGQSQEAAVHHREALELWPR